MQASNLMSVNDRIEDLIVAVNRLTVQVSTLVDNQDRLQDSMREINNRVTQADNNRIVPAPQVALGVPEAEVEENRPRRIGIGDRIRVTNSRNAEEQLGTVTKVTAGRVFFAFDNTRRHAWRARHNVQRIK